MPKLQSKYLKYLKPSEVADMLDVSIDTVYRWVREGKIKSVRIVAGKRVWIRIPEDEVKRITGVQ
jgi:excisionase family DNA binding protein